MVYRYMVHAKDIRHNDLPDPHPPRPHRDTSQHLHPPRQTRNENPQEMAREEEPDCQQQR